MQIGSSAFSSSTKSDLRKMLSWLDKQKPQVQPEKATAATAQEPAQLQKHTRACRRV